MKDCNLEKFSLNDREENIDAHVYQTLIGSLLYLTNGWFNVMHATCLLLRYIIFKVQLDFIMGLLKECYDTWRGLAHIQFGTQIEDFQLCGFSDSDHRNTICCTFNLHSNAIAWYSKKHSFIALSSSKEKHMAVTLVACQAIWLRRILKDIHQREATIPDCDNES